MKYFKLTILLFAIVLLFTSCNKDKIDTIKDEAIILYEGDPVVDGCGYFLLVKEIKYKPIELNSDFLIDRLVVNIEYQLLDTKWSCNWQEKEYSQIKVINISKKIKNYEIEF